MRQPRGELVTVVQTCALPIYSCKRIRAGALSVNGGMSITGDLPFGGYKQSGVGREWGLAGIVEFTEIKAIGARVRSEEHTSELQSLMRLSYAVFCLEQIKTHQSVENKSFTSHALNHSNI